jgi:hypothetical protein
MIIYNFKWSNRSDCGILQGTMKAYIRNKWNHKNLKEKWCLVQDSNRVFITQNWKALLLWWPGCTVWKQKILYNAIIYGLITVLFTFIFLENILKNWTGCISLALRKHMEWNWYSASMFVNWCTFHEVSSSHKWSIRHILLRPTTVQFPAEWTGFVVLAVNPHLQSLNMPQLVETLHKHDLELDKQKKLSVVSFQAECLSLWCHQQCTSSIHVGY